MRLNVAREGESFFVQGEWVDQFGVHTRAMKPDFTPEVEAALDVLLTWADGCEASYAEAVGGYENRRAIEAEMALLNARLKALDKAKKK